MNDNFVDGKVCTSLPCHVTGSCSWLAVALSILNNPVLYFYVAVSHLLKCAQGDTKLKLYILRSVYVQRESEYFNEIIKYLNHDIVMTKYGTTFIQS